MHRAVVSTETLGLSVGIANIQVRPEKVTSRTEFECLPGKPLCSFGNRILERPQGAIDEILMSAADFGLDDAVLRTPAIRQRPASGESWTM